MKIRFFNTYEPVSAFYRDIVPALVKQGAKVEIVISKAEYRKGRDIIQAFQHMPNVRFIRTTSLGRNAYEGTAAKALATVLYAISASLYALFGPSVDRNVFLTQPPLFALLGVLLHRLRRQPYYYVLMDIQPQLSIALGLADENAWLTRLSARLSQIAMRNAEGVVVIGRGMAEYVERLGIEKQRIHFIANWADETQIYPIPAKENRLRQDMGWDDQFIVLYAGNIGLPQYFDDLLSVAARLRKSDDIRFVFVGGGSRQTSVARQVTQQGLKNVTLLPFLHETYSLAEILSSADVHFASLQADCTALAVPSKAYGVLAAGRPLIFQGGAAGEIARLIGEHRIGFAIPIGQVDSLEAIIMRLHDDPLLCQEFGRKARALVMTTYSKVNAVQQYIALLMDDLQNVSLGDGR